MRSYLYHEDTGDVVTHLGYYLPDVACTDQVVATFD